MTVAERRQYPSIFLRVFLSHLLLLLSCFLSGIALYVYLFAPGAHLFIYRNPLILIPLLLGLISIAGLLSIWTSGAIAVPLGHIEKHFKHNGAGPNLEELSATALTEEVDSLIHVLVEKGYPIEDQMKTGITYDNSELVNTAFIIETSTDFFIVQVNESARQYFGAANILTGSSFVDCISVPELATLYRQKIRDEIERADHLVEFGIPFRNGNAFVVTILWNTIRRYASDGAILGYTFFGQLSPSSR